MIRRRNKDVNSGQKHQWRDGVVAQASLRILATSDLHMNLRGFNYITGKPQAKAGLAQLASMITQARTENGEGACILLDNGDALQGAPIADTAAQPPLSYNHPMALAFDALGYDAIGLGNHDFDYGLDFLDTVSTQYKAPTVCSNIASEALSDVRMWTIVDQQATCSDGVVRDLKVGVVSVLPEQTMIWNSKHLSGRASIGSMQDAVNLQVPKVKAAGADLVVLLAHSGIGRDDGPKDAENAALQLSNTPDIDAVIAGHTHNLFPDCASQAVPGSDPVKGTLNGTPAAMPGFGGSHLAVLDLNLGHANGAWHVLNHCVTLRSAPCTTLHDPAILQATDAAHQRTKVRMEEAVGVASAPLNSYFSLLHTSSDLTFIAHAKRLAMQRHIAGTAHAELPLLVSTSAQASGGKAGPDNYVAFDKGPLRRRDVIPLVPFDNAIWGRVVTARDVREWLERCAAVFAIQRPDTPDQMLLDPNAPGFNFDVLHGVDFTINPTRPSRYDPDGTLVDKTAYRVENLTFDGAPLEDSQQFLMASNSYRLAGGGQYPGCTTQAVSVRCEETVNDALAWLIHNPLCQADAPESRWALSPGLDLHTIYKTSPAARTHLAQIARYKPVDLGDTADGFCALRLHL
ncbi:5'-nucleotidase C-terminal domain-containing protein [Ascidiaceihabitans sp.]|uniref:5'-nucleotidase C-terminal domain-containing protein n=1 Tax=Ascidiaceihabitans sp. TaxID=1872644 RepID=UPI0032987747